MLILAAVSPVVADPDAGPAAWQIAIPAKSANQAELEQKAQADGALPVIVMLDARFQPEGDLASPAAVSSQRAALQAAQDSLLRRLSSYEPQSVKRFGTIPFLALSVTPAGLAALEADPAVLNIAPDVAEPVSLAESVPLIGAPAMWSAGYSGAGQVVAVLDTGVDKNHPFLAGKVVEEACFSTTNFSASSKSLCPGGADESAAVDSALPYDTGVCPPGACDHGTHVAGIAAGHAYDNAQGTVPFNGVAKDASIIAIQVFSAFPATSCNSGEDCVMSYTSDQILGMERVLELDATYHIAVVNLSLGGGVYDNQTDCDEENASRKAVIDNLRAAGIATVIASGNSYYTDSMNAPACISSAISVGSTDDGSGGTAIDVLSPYSNVASFLTLLAPGNPIRSSIPGGQYATWAGTSMAAPHVAGAWAVLKQKYSEASVDQIEALLTASGKPVTDTRSWSKTHVTKPRLNLAFSISGHVTTGSGTSAAGLKGVSISADPAHTAVSGSDGAYTLGGLPLGSYTLTPNLPDTSFTPGSQAVSGGPDRTSVDFSATQLLFTISGKVTLGSAAGAPGLEGVTVSAGAGHAAATDANGEYVLGGLEAGTYWVTPSRKQYCFAPLGQVETVGGSRPGVNFAATLAPYQIYLAHVVSGAYNYSVFMPVLISN